MATTASQPITPLISGGIAGPLGLVHLPRLWLKIRLHALGVLPEGYRSGNGGNDAKLFDAIGLDGEAFVAYVSDQSPDYQQLEAWVRANASNAAPEPIAEFNALVLSMELGEPRRTEWNERFGLDGFSNGVGLNQLDDWDLVHAELLAPDARTAPLVPAISSSVAGPIGIFHLPRLWLKHLAASTGRLPDGYFNGDGAFDRKISETIGYDGHAFKAFVETDKPGYLAVEAWVRAHAANLTPQALAETHAYYATAKMPERLAVSMRERFRIEDPSFDLGVPLNDLDDWAALHAQLLALS